MNMSGGSIVWILDAETGQFNRAMLQAERQAQSTGSAVDRSISRGADNAASAIGNLTKRIGAISWNVFERGATVFGGALVALGSSGVASANQLQSLQLSMNGLTKSMDLGRKAMAAAYEYAQTSPFQTVQTASAMKTMIAFGMSVEDATSNLKTLGNISITSGVPIESMAGIFGRVAAQGRLMGGDIQQLTENGVAILPQLQKQLGKTAEEVREMASNGEIGFATFRQAMADLVDPTILDQLNNTLPRQLDRLNGSIRQMAFSLIGASVDATNGFTLMENSIGQSVINITKLLADGLRTEEIKKPLADLGLTLLPIFQAIEKAIPPIISGIGKMIAGLSEIGPLLLPLLGLMVGSFGGLFAQFPIIGELLAGFSGPMGLFVGLMAALVAYSPDLRAGIIDAFGILGDTLKELRPEFDLILTTFKQAAQTVGIALRPVLVALAEALSAVLKAVVPLLPIFGETLATALVAILPALVPILEVIADLATAFNNLSPETKTLIVQALLLGMALNKASGLIAPFVDMGQKVAGVFGMFKKGGKGAGAAVDAIGGVKDTAEAVTGGAQALTKGQQAVATMRSGIFNIALLAGAIVALGYSLKLANDAIPDDMSKLGPKLGVMAAVVAGMGALAWAAGRVNLNYMSMVTLGSMAGVIAALALSLQYMNTAIPDDFGKMLPKLGLMAGVITGIGVLSFVASKVRVNVASLMTLVGIAGVIAVVATAIQYANKVLPDDVGNFALKIANLAIAMVAIGGLAVAASALMGPILPGLLVLLAISGTLVLVGMAVQDANKRLPSNVGEFALKIANLSIAVTAIGLLSAAFGAVALTGVGAALIAAGLVTMLAIVGATVLMAKGIEQINRSVPDDIGQVKTKIDVMSDVLKHISEANIGNLIGNFVGAVNLGIVTRMVDFYRHIAVSLAYIAAVPLNAGAVKAKVALIKDVIQYISGTGNESIGGQIANLVKNFIGTFNTATLSRTVDIYFDIAQTLARIQAIPLNPAAIKAKIGVIGDVVKSISATDGTSVAGTINVAVNNFINAINMDNIARVVDTYGRMATTLDTIQNINLNPGAIKAKIAMIGDVIKSVSYSGPDSIWSNLTNAVNNFLNASSVESAGKVVQTYAGITDALKKIEGLTLNYGAIQTNVGNLSNVLKMIMSTSGGGGLVGAMNSMINGGAITPEQVGKVQSIINKMSEIAKTLNGMVSLGGNTIPKITGIRDAIYAIGQIHEVANIGNKEWIVNMSTSILYKMTEFARVLNSMVSLGGNSQAKITGIRDAIYSIGQVNEVPGMGNKEWIVGMASSILYKMTEMARVINAMPVISPEKLTAVRNARHAVWEIAQVNENVGNLANKEAILQSAIRMVGTLGQFVNAANGIGAVNNAQIISAGTTLVNQFIAGVNAAVPNVTPAAANIQATFWRAIQARMADHYYQGMALVSQLVNGVNAGAANAGPAGQRIQSAVWQGVQARIGDMYAQGVAMANQVLNGVRAGASGGAAAGNAIQSAIWLGIQNRLPDMYNQGRALANNVANGAGSMGGALYDKGRGMQSSIWRGVQDRMGDMYHQGRALASNLTRGMGDGAGGAYSSGANATQGFINGANSKSTYSTGWNIANNFLNGLKARAGERSPWKTTTMSGNYAIQGLEQGIQDGQRSLINTAASVVDSVMGVFSQATPTITPQFAAVDGGYDLPYNDTTTLSRSLGAFESNAENGGYVENHIGQITIASEVDAENWLQKLTRQDEVTRTGLTSNA